MALILVLLGIPEPQLWGQALSEPAVPEASGEIRPQEQRSSPSESKAPERDGVFRDPEVAKEVQLEEVVVTATRTDLPISDVPESVTVIDTEELERSALKSVEDELRSVAGVDVWGNNLDPLGHRAVSVRGVGGGTSQERTLILIDGIPANDTWSGSVAWGQLAKEDIAKIEVVRGPSSSLYGPNAMGGVINIITRMPREQPIGATLKGTYGEFDTWYTYGNASGRLFDGSFGYYVSGKYYDTDGYIARYKDQTPTETKNAAEMGNSMGKLYWFIDDYSYLKLGASYFREDRNKGYSFSHLDPGEVKRGDITYRRDTPDGIDWLAMVYGHDEQQRHENDDWMHTVLNRITTYDKPFYGAILQPSFPIADWNTLTVGAEYRHSGAEQRDVYETEVRETKVRGKQQYYGVYFQDEAKLFGDRLVLVPGVRFDHWKSYDGSSLDTSLRRPADEAYESQSWESFNPKIGAVLHLSEQTSLRATVGTGYRAPSPVELYASSMYGSNLVLGNPELKPEQILSYELGATHAISGWFDARLTLYHATIEDMIETRTLERVGWLTIRQKDNVGEVVARGLELEAFYHITKLWHGFANYTYNESKIRENDEEPYTVDNLLGHSPRHKANFGLTFDHPRIITATVQAHFTGDSYDDNTNTVKLGQFWTADLFLARRIGERLTLAFDVENLFDRRYDMPSFNTYKAPGRLWAASLTLDF